MVGVPVGVRHSNGKPEPLEAMSACSRDMLDCSTCQLEPQLDFVSRPLALFRSYQMASSAPSRDSLERQLEELMAEGQSQANAGDERPLTPVDPSVQPPRKRLRGADLSRTYLKVCCMESCSFLALRPSRPSMPLTQVSCVLRRAR